jgi:hypothetical protein
MCWKCVVLTIQTSISLTDRSRKPGESAHTGMKFFETVPRHVQLIKYITTRGCEMLLLVAHTKRPKTLGIHDINTHLF